MLFHRIKECETNCILIYEQGGEEEEEEEEAVQSQGGGSVPHDDFEAAQGQARRADEL